MSAPPSLPATVPELIRKKRDGGELSRREIAGLVAAFTAAEVPDYQMSALLMAVFFRGMTPDETAALTEAMVGSGRRLDLSSLPGPKADKHSTGGVGDKTTLVVAPLVAAAGLPVAKLSGRGLGHTGGTLDKLESIPGLTVHLEMDDFIRQVGRVGLAVAGQTADLVPADARLYALRDVTATVDSIPLIASSVMSKKIAGGADAVILDVKVGRGAFMREAAAARELAGVMIGLGRAFGRRVGAVLSAMDQPLGRAVGNALEVAEAVEVLSGGGPEDVWDLSLELGARLLVLAGVERGAAPARARLEAARRDGRARAKLAEMVAAQGGDPAVLDDPGRLPRAPLRRDLPAPASGVVTGVDALAVGGAAVLLGAGRRRKGDAVDPAVGVVLHRKVGDPVRAGEALATVHARDEATAAAALERLRLSYRIGDIPPDRPQLILETLFEP